MEPGAGDNITLSEAVSVRELYNYMKGLPFPYRYAPEFGNWKQSFLSDVDGDGRRLFSQLTTLEARSEGALAGFVQYGRTAFGFDGQGEISQEISYPVIRGLWFDRGQEEAGRQLLHRAAEELVGNSSDRLYAFFHYFGMSCYARHGKLHEGLGHIHRLLLEEGFTVEHENVFYSSVLFCETPTLAQLIWHAPTAGGERECDFLLDGENVGGCRVHFLQDCVTAYLRWIYIREPLRGRGIGTCCMSALRSRLQRMGIVLFDTDTALSNRAAQHFYEKNHFKNRGLTRSYWRDTPDK